jgi:hypothetical protein
MIFIIIMIIMAWGGHMHCNVPLHAWAKIPHEAKHFLALTTRVQQHA